MMGTFSCRIKINFYRYVRIDSTSWRRNIFNIDMSLVIISINSLNTLQRSAHAASSIRNSISRLVRRKLTCMYGNNENFQISRSIIRQCAIWRV